MKHFMYFCLLAVCVIPIVGQNKQSCQYFKEETTSCPTVFIFEEVSADCCGHLPNKTLHCVLGYYEDDKQFMIHDCLEEKPIPAGHAMTIVNNSCVAIQCDNETYQPDERPSNMVRHEYCTEMKSICSYTGQQLGCKGGPTADDGCICQEGYRSKCHPNCGEHCGGFFGDDDACPCIKDECPPGTARNIDYNNITNCSAGPVQIDYTCYNISSTTAPQTTTPHSVTTSSNTTNEQELTQEGIPWWLLLLLILICVILFVILFVLYKCNQKFRTLVCDWIEQIRQRFRQLRNSMSGYSKANTGPEPGDRETGV